MQSTIRNDNLCFSPFHDLYWLILNYVTCNFTNLQHYCRQQLEAMLNELKELPARLRMYDSYEYVRKLLQSYTKVHTFDSWVMYTLSCEEGFLIIVA